MMDILDLLWFTLFQAFIPMNDEVNVTEVDVSSYGICYDKYVENLEFLSPEGVVRLILRDVHEGMTLSYSVVSTVTGNLYFLLCLSTKVVALTELLSFRLSVFAMPLAQNRCALGVL